MSVVVFDCQYVIFIAHWKDISSGVFTGFMLCVFNCVKRWLIEESQVHENVFLLYVRGSMYSYEQYVYNQIYTIGN